MQVKGIAKLNTKSRNHEIEGNSKIECTFYAKNDVVAKIYAHLHFSRKAFVGIALYALIQNLKEV